MFSISVIIPVFNRQHTIGRALDSVTGQTRPVREIIVVDDGSTDNTADVVRGHYPDVTLIRQSHAGVSAARNRGIESANSDWIALLDSDDTWHPEKIEYQLALHKSCPGFLISHTDEIWIRNGMRVNPMKKHRKYGGHIFPYCIPRCVISPSAVLLHRKLFDEIGNFDETLPACEDYDLWLRLCNLYPVLFSEHHLVTKYGGHADQLSRKFTAMDRFRIRALLKLLDNPALTPSHRRLVVPALCDKLAIYLRGAKKHANQENVDEFSRYLDHYAHQLSDLHLSS